MLCHMIIDSQMASKEIVEVKKFTLIRLNILHITELQI
jgi:hypothetical protein